MSVVSIRGVNKWFDRREGEPLHVLQNIDIEVPARAIVALLGASGCGKSTLLNIIAGLIPPDSGTVLLDDVPSAEFRNWHSMTYMFQEDRLLPWRTAAQNVAFGLEAESLPATERRRRARETLALVGLAGFEDVYPHELSGGMRSRVALARSLVTEPAILLMDEPFSKLDPSIRAQMHAEVLRIASLRKMTLIFVTHDVEEAIVLADHVVVLHPRPGRVGEARAIDLPYPRNPLAPDVAEAVRGLRLALAGLSPASC
ncbi:ABC transporter ATP-binding protein [Methylobacterium sp. E-041]|jgi:ABC-type nitrate/sulfonate/bicarbonate transport system ATPase subunit|uniref:ABC transporter ATP-binding protein n=1 Tax=unclassified Methylobacterium TaxID=2615210 RepID=UPI001FB99E1B|nr:MULTISPECIES: ABC transporter ATP-binding protein [unclassified Methylobacterium]MCJ2076329.1 ABC transporter ATP-binding protein [Methylobacterium sp. E-016]MCJ2105809.1 ABC transporter ATP-binding protein [Methylobacterium sp. E-041]MCJ2113584.1 ABC transporter ATP-binding protein [Methylobacterium sp. E-025]